MTSNSQIKLFVLANSLAENSLNRIESDFEIDLGRNDDTESDNKEYYAQFSNAFRAEARTMAKHYEIFYCLEKSIRDLVVESMKEKHGDNWWVDKVDQNIRKEVDSRIKKEVESGFTERSNLEIDYSTFGELAEVVRSNWDAFSHIFKNVKAFSRITSNLNQLRGPIAHCCPLAPDEAVRLDTSVKDWFRLMD